MKARIVPAVFLFLALPFSVSAASAFTDEAPPQKPAPIPVKIHKNYFSWNPLDLILTGRMVVGYERVFKVGSRTFGLYAQYTSPMNSVWGGIMTAWQNKYSLSDEVIYPSGFELYVNYYAKGRPRQMRYFPRLGLSVLRAPEAIERALYMSIGPCAKVPIGKNGHVVLALTTFKFKLAGNKNYSWMLLPVFDFMVGLDF
jgi:hypothetical protein